MHVPSLAITLLSLSLVTARAPPHHRHLGKAPLGKRHELVRRAGGAISNDTIDAMPSDEANMLTHGAAAATSSAVVAETSEAAGSGQAGDIVTPTTSPTAVVSSVQPTTAPSSSAAAPSVVVASTSESEVEQVVASPSPSIVESSAIASPSTTPLSVVNAPVTLSSVAPTVVTAHVASSERATVVTKTRTDSSSASAASSNDHTSEKSGGLSKTALIAIIVVASVVGAGAILVFAIRKWKLRKSGRFDSRMKPIDFSPHNDGMGNDDFLEKTLQRTTSNASADRQRQQFVKELEADPNYVAGVPEHDFTAGAAANHAGYGAYNDTYNDDPFARAQVYEYDQDAYYGHDAHGYPPAEPHVGYAQGVQDYPTQDQPAEGYADLQRGNSTGSDHARSAGGHGSAQFTDFPSPDNYLGRPTGGIDGPYAQAAQYRAY